MNYTVQIDSFTYKKTRDFLSLIKIRGKKYRTFINGDKYIGDLIYNGEKTINLIWLTNMSGKAHVLYAKHYPSD